MITLKRTRNTNSGTLSVTGRDVEEMVYKLSFVDGMWQPDDGELAAAANKLAEPKLGQKMQKVLELVNSRSQTTAADVVIKAGIPHATARQYLGRLADDHGLITRLATGTYGPVTVSQVSRDADDVISDDGISGSGGDPEDRNPLAEPSPDDFDLVG